MIPRRHLRPTVRILGTLRGGVLLTSAALLLAAALLFVPEIIEALPGPLRILSVLLLLAAAALVPALVAVWGRVLQIPARTFPGLALILLLTPAARLLLPRPAPTGSAHERLRQAEDDLRARRRLRRLGLGLHRGEDATAAIDRRGRVRLLRALPQA